MIHPYASLPYANGLSHIGKPFHVPEWGCHVLIREIEDGLHDAVGAYPLAVINEDADLAGGLKRLKEQGFVSVVMVLDDFHRPRIEAIAKNFAVCEKFKTHYLHVPEKGKPPNDSYHRNMLNTAMKSLRVGEADLKREIEQWKELYAGLISHRELKGWHVFPPTYHEMLAELEGAVAIGAWLNDKMVSCHVWMRHNGHVTSHLAATSEEGYGLFAAYAVNHFSLGFFADEKAVNLGGGLLRIGETGKTKDGLASFKRKFHNAEAASYLCGAVLNRSAYDDLMIRRSVASDCGFFPAYRGVAG